jgi:hypothetical protein
MTTTLSKSNSKRGGSDCHKTRTSKKKSYGGRACRCRPSAMCPKGRHLTFQCADYTATPIPPRVSSRASIDVARMLSQAPRSRESRPGACGGRPCGRSSSVRPWSRLCCQCAHLYGGSYAGAGDALTRCLVAGDGGVAGGAVISVPLLLRGALAQLAELRTFNP